VAGEIASTIATSSDQNAKQAATERFWALYWKELALVEDEYFESAMAVIGVALRKPVNNSEVKELSLRLARACRSSFVSFPVKGAIQK